MKQIYIFWTDLTEKKQKEIIKQVGHEDFWSKAWTKSPMAVLELKEEDDE